MNFAKRFGFGQRTYRKVLIKLALQKKLLISQVSGKIIIEANEIKMMVKHDICVVGKKC